MQIVGDRYRIPSNTEERNIEFAFDQILKGSIAKFSKLICITDNEGNAIINQLGKYTLDTSKYLAITEAYLKGLGLVSTRERVISNTMLELKGLVPASFSIEHYFAPEVISLIDFPAQEQMLREALAQVSDGAIDSTSEKFLDE